MTAPENSVVLPVAFNSLSQDPPLSQQALSHRHLYIGKV